MQPAILDMVAASLGRSILKYLFKMKLPLDTDLRYLNSAYAISAVRGSLNMVALKLLLLAVLFHPAEM